MTYTIVEKCSKCDKEVKEKKVVESYVGAYAVVVYKENIDSIALSANKYVSFEAGLNTKENGTFVNDRTTTSKEDARRIYEPTTKVPFTTEAVKLTDCSKTGKYTVNFYNGDGKLIDTKTWEVAAHHTTETIDTFKTLSDAKQCELKDKVIVNNSCYLPVTYTTWTYCTCTGHSSSKKVTGYTINGVQVPESGDDSYTTVISSETKTVEPTGAHNIDTVAKTEIDAYVNSVKTSANNKLTIDLLKDAVEDAHENTNVENKYVKYSEDTSTCTADGTVKVEYVCMLCGKVDESKTQTVNVAAKGHSMVYVRENDVEPTCQKEGSYDRVKKCEVCGEVESTEHIGVAKLAHKYDGIKIVITPSDSTAKVIDRAGELLKEKGTEYTADYVDDFTVKFGYARYDGQVTINAVKYCVNCNETEDIDDTTGKLTVTVDDIKKQDEKGQGGYITLSAVYTYTVDGKDVTLNGGTTTFPYYSTETSYTGRTEAEETVKNGLVKDSDGVYRYYVNNEVAKDTTGIVYYDGAQFYVTNGVLDTTVSGLTQNPADGKWYMLANGQVQSQYSGGAQYDGRWFYLTNGVLDTAANGLVAYNGGTFLFAAGQLQNQVNGLWQDFDGTWYFLANGQVQSQHTGVTVYDGAAFYVVDGKLATDYNGTVQYDGATFKVVAGQLYAA
jgi:hypothetical protein